MPLIGLLSDSHGHADTTARAVTLLVDHGAQMLIHLGDVERPQVLDELLISADTQGHGGEVLPVHVVFGNVDYDAADLGRYATQIGLNNHHPVGRLTFDGRVLSFMHGHDQRAMQRELDDEVDWLCFGHTHRKCDRRQGRTRLINPGALFRAAEYTVALLDTEADEVAFFTLPRSC